MSVKMINGYGYTYTYICVCTHACTLCGEDWHGDERDLHWYGLIFLHTSVHMRFRTSFDECSKDGGPEEYMDDAAG